MFVNKLLDLFKYSKCPLLKLEEFMTNNPTHIILLLVEAKNLNLNLGEKIKLSDEGAQLSVESQVR